MTELLPVVAFIKGSYFNLIQFHKHLVCLKHIKDTVHEPRQKGEPTQEIKVVAEY